jgi:hypothetical protein
MSNRYDSRVEMEQPSNLFDAVATRDHEFLITEFIKCSRNALVAYLPLKKNWQCELFQGEQNSERIFRYTYTLFLRYKRIHCFDVVVCHHPLRNVAFQ